MTRGIFGAVLLLILLACGMFVQYAMGTIHTPVAQALTQAAQAAAYNQWESARTHQLAAATAWKKSWHLTAAFADHMPMEDIDALFARLDNYAREENTAEYTATCRELTGRIQSIPDAHTLSWWNVL